MQFTYEDVDGVRMISVPSVDIDARNAEEFKKDIVPIIEGRSKVLVDLGSVGFMDSAGLGALLSAYKKVRAEGGQFKVARPSDAVKALFDLVRMHRLFEVHADTDTAIKAFS